MKVILCKSDWQTACRTELGLEIDWSWFCKYNWRGLVNSWYCRSPVNWLIISQAVTRICLTLSIGFDHQLQNQPQRFDRRGIRPVIVNPVMLPWYNLKPCLPQLASNSWINIVCRNSKSAWCKESSRSHANSAPADFHADSHLPYHKQWLCKWNYNREFLET
jgi:hypothetical protein